MKSFKDTDMKLLLGRVLRAGTIISVGIVIIGGICFLVRHGLAPAGYKTFTGIPNFIQHFSGILWGIGTFKGQAIIQFGIILLIATPIMRIIFSAIGFVLEKDYLYVGISLLVLGIIFVSMLSGHAG